MQFASNNALIIVQQAVWVLAKWAGVSLPEKCHVPTDCAATIQAKKILNWGDTSSSNILNPLRLLFDTKGRH